MGVLRTTTTDLVHLFKKSFFRKLRPKDTKDLKNDDIIHLHSSFSIEMLKRFVLFAFIKFSKKKKSFQMRRLFCILVPGTAIP